MSRILPRVLARPNSRRTIPVVLSCALGLASVLVIQVPAASAVPLTKTCPTGFTMAAGATDICELTIESSGSWTVPEGVWSIDVLIVGGGGGGGSYGPPSGDLPGYGSGGGGGGGQALVLTDLTVRAGQIASIDIGAGGEGGIRGADGSNGDASSFIYPGYWYTAGAGQGGRKGSAEPDSGGAGGAGGDGGAGDDGDGGSGGNSTGAGLPGSDGRVPTDGLFSGNTTAYGGGGGGGSGYPADASRQLGGAGGDGGGGAGGDGGNSISVLSSSAGQDGFGGGGGGGSHGSNSGVISYTGADGGSGVVILRTEAFNMCDADVFVSGNGSIAAPFVIGNEDQLIYLASEPGCWWSNFEQAGSIELQEAWIPIGDEYKSFSGNYDGNGSRIENLTIDDASNYSGFFGNTDGATITAVNLVGATITGADESDRVGALIGFATETEVSYVSSSLGSVLGDSYIGGLIGHATNSQITNATTSGWVGSEISTGFVGGIVGEAEGVDLTDISSSSRIQVEAYGGGLVGRATNTNILRGNSTGEVFGLQSLGGIVGSFGAVSSATITEGTYIIQDSTASGDVTSNVEAGYSAAAGGLIGRVEGRAEYSDENFGISIRDSHASGHVSGEHSMGGFIGQIGMTLELGGAALALDITDSSASGIVTGVYGVGGFVGDAIASTLPLAGSLARNSASGNVIGNLDTGGFAGRVTQINISDSYATGIVAPNGSVASTLRDVGGFAGYVDANSTLNRVRSSGSVQGGDHVGGLVGKSDDNSTISRSWSTGSVQGNGSVGGLVGFLQNGSEVVESYATGSVVGAVTSTLDGLVAGGLIGTMFDDASITRSFSTGNVVGRQRVGGLVGQAGDDSGSGRSLSISDSYSTGSTSAPGFSPSTPFDAAIGALIGINQHSLSVTNTYSTGQVSSVPSTFYVGGITGDNDVPMTASASFWDSETTGMFSAAGSADNSPNPITGTAPLTTTQIRSATNFPGWNFSTVWGYDCSLSARPLLRWAYPSATATSAETCPSISPVLPVPSPQSSSNTANSETPAINRPFMQAPGTSGMRINGQEVPVSTKRGGRGGGLTLQAGPVRFTLRSETASGKRVPLAPDGSLVLARSGEVPISGGGLEPSSTVSMALFSDPISLGSVTAGGDGSFAARPVIPSTVPVGAHTLQLTGRTKTGDQFVLSIGVLVATPAAAVGADPVLSVQPKVVKPGASVVVIARGVQAGCRVTFTIAGERERTLASKKGMAQAHITMPMRLPKNLVLKATVGGAKCSMVTVSKQLPTKK